MPTISLNINITVPEGADALSKLNTAARRARTALDAYNENKFDSCFYYLNLLFGERFPSRSG